MEISGLFIKDVCSFFIVAKNKLIWQNEFGIIEDKRNAVKLTHGIAVDSFGGG
jgi:hypothetical protein